MPVKRVKRGKRKAGGSFFKSIGKAVKKVASPKNLSKVHSFVKKNNLVSKALSAADKVTGINGLSQASYLTSKAGYGRGSSGYYIAGSHDIGATGRGLIRV